MTEFTNHQEYAELEFKPDPACTNENWRLFKQKLTEFCQSAEFAYSLLGKTKAELIDTQSLLPDDLARRLAEEFDRCADMAVNLKQMFEEAERRHLVVLANH
jgi:hypothetical protein